MKIGLIGAGNLATNLGLALYRAGHNIVYVYSRTQASAGALAHRLGCQSTTDICQAATWAHECQVVVLSVKDSVLAHLAAMMPTGGNTLYLHTAGSMSMDTLPMARRGVLYPMQTFSREREADFANIPTFLEVQDEADHDTLEQLAASITAQRYWISSQDRKYLHLAAVFACNFSNLCMNMADELLQRAGIPFDVMLPLTDETARKLHHMTPLQAQTGPAVRYDLNVIERHLNMLADDPEKQHIYRTMSEMIHNRATKND